MLRKHNKLIMLLVLVTFMFTMVGSAGAASYSDVTGTSTEASAISRLSGLGVLEGYPDGTFGPEKTITRAEFAKIACVTAGLKSVASGMGGTASTFSDVASDHWANGWINVAAAQGFVKGYPEGTFKPEDKISQAEVITVLLRLLGYNDNLPGNWPSDYIAKAANLGVLDDITFVANADATRGVVAVLTSANLDENVVEYAASDNLFNEAQKTYSLNGAAAKAQSYTLLYDKFNKSAKYKDALAIQFRYVDGDTYLEYFQYNEDQDTIVSQSAGVVGAVAGNLIEKKLAKDCVFSGGGSILNAIENFVQFDVNKDGDISNIIVEDYASVGPKLSATAINTEVKVKSGKAEVASKTYSFLPRAQVVQESIFPTEFTASGTGFADGTFNASDAYRLILNKNGKVAGLRGYTFPTPGIVDKVVGDRIYYLDTATPLKVGNPLGGTTASFAGAFVGFSSQGNFTDKDIYVQKDGKPATLADIQALDTINVLEGYRGTDYYVIATSMKIPGQLASAEYSGLDVKKVTVMGMKWTAPYTDFTFLLTGTKGYTTRFSIDDGATIEGNLSAATLDSEYDMWNQDVKVLTSATGKVAGLVFGSASSASKMYGVITEITPSMAWTDGTTVRNIKVMKEDGTEYSYPISDDTYIKKTGPAASFNLKIKDLNDATKFTAATMSKAATANYNLSGVGGTAIDQLIQYSAAMTEDVEGLVAVSLKSSGLVDRVEVIDQVTPPIVLSTTGVVTLDTDSNLIKLGGVWCDAKDVVAYNIWNAADLGDTKVVGWKELKNSANNITAYYKDSNNKAKYVVMNGAKMTSGANYAIYESSYSASDYWIKFVGQDAMKRDSSIGSFTKGDVLTYTTSGSTIDTATKVVAYGAGSAVTVEKVSGSSFEVKNNITNATDSYKTDSDTLYFDVTDDNNLKTLDGVAVGDAVVVFADATGMADAVAVVDYDLAAPKLVSASRLNDTTIVLTFDQDLNAATIAANAAKFTVVDTVTPATTYAVGAAVYGPAANPALNSKQMVLVTANVSVSKLNGLTVTYAAGGTIADLVGNKVASTTGTIAAW